MAYRQRLSAVDAWSIVIRPPLLQKRQMPAYRLYYLDHTGSIRRALELTCESDDEAIEHANRNLDGAAMELWDRDRVVMRFGEDRRASNLAGSDRSL